MASSTRRKRRPGTRESITIELSAVIVAASPEEPRVLTVWPERQGLVGLPSGPLEPRHRTLEAGLRAWVQNQTQQTLGYVEQLYTFGDRNRRSPDGDRLLSIGYLALVREARSSGPRGALWRGWYGFFPWEDWRAGRPAVLERIVPRLLAWAADAPNATERRRREERLRLTFGLCGGPWSDERVLERYELLYEVGLVPEAHRDGVRTWASRRDVVAEAEAMAGDHRRILATGIARLRGKIRYRPVVFEALPASFTFLRLQQTVEALAGMRLHKPNFRRLVEHQGLVEETGEMTTETGGRPARLLRFRREVLRERPATGGRLPITRDAG
jgi:hypothetical protein